MKSGMIGSGKLPIDYLIFNIEQITELSPSEKDAISKGSNFSIGITPYYSQHIENSALRKKLLYLSLKNVNSIKVNGMILLEKRTIVSQII